MMQSFDPLLLERIPKEVLMAARLVADWFDADGGSGSLCGIGPVHHYYEVGTAAPMPGAPAFTVAVFDLKDVHSGSKLYVKE